MKTVSAFTSRTEVYQIWFSQRRRLFLCALAVVSLLPFAGCAHSTVNQRIENYETMVTGYLEPTAERRADELLLSLAFSGGGTRAAALSYGVLEALDKVSVPRPGYEADTCIGEDLRQTLLDQVDIISSVSGGSVTAAYYGLYGRQIFDDFKPRFLYRNVNRDILLRALSPLNLIRLGSTYFGRSDLAATYYDDLLFHGATFGDLRGKDPGIFIQATDIVDGIYFAFTPAYFSLICSDLDSFPISRAVAASAAFPGPFTAITLRNYSGTCGFQPKPWMAEALEKRDTTSRLFNVARHASTYLDPAQKPYVHLVDGGVADNLALRGPLEVIMGRGGLAETLKALGRERVSRVAFIIVNAEKETQTTWGSRAGGPGILSILGMTSSVMISSYNYETVDLLRRTIEEWSKESQQAGGHPIEFYAIEVAFNTLHDEKERKYFSSISTSFNLPDETVNQLIDVAGRILHNSEEFQKLVRDLGGQIPSILDDSQTKPIPSQE